MKNLLYLLSAVILIASCDKSSDPEPEVNLNDSISMGQGYANEIYYSLENGEVASVDRSSWDLAFSTDPMSSTVLINEGYGLELYTYPHGDKDAWASIDTAGMASWPPMYNSDDSWLNGAFDRNATGHPDYGWGVYNTQTHDVVGDSLFILKLNDGSLKKVFIEKRAAMTNSFTLRYGNLDEEGMSQEIECKPYLEKNFIYFSFANEEVKDLEPISDSWDLLFTKYHDESIPYIVTGVLINRNLENAEVRGMDPELADPADATFNEIISEIGSDWKTFDMGSFAYLIEPELCYFVKKEERMHKLTFKATDGSASGKMVFQIEKQD